MTAKEALYKLLRIAIGNESDLTLPAEVSLPEVMDLSERAGVSGLAVCGVQKLEDFEVRLASMSKADKPRLMSWVGASIQMEQSARRQWEDVQDLVGLFASKGITTVGLKGLTVGQWYPDPMLRDSCDFDCFLLKEGSDGVREFAFEEGNRAVEACGVEVDRRIYVHSIFSFKGLTVENHHYLAAVKLGRRLRQMDGLLCSLLVDEPLQPVLGTRLMTGSPMFNAVFLTHHAHRHFLNEYMPLKLLVDWALFVKHNAGLDWERFWRYADEFGMLRFAQAMTRLACRLLGAGVAVELPEDSGTSVGLAPDARVPFELPRDDEADELLEASLWDLPDDTPGRKSLFARRLNIITNLLYARQRYKVFYDRSSLHMILAYVKGFLFGGEV